MATRQEVYLDNEFASFTLKGGESTLVPAESGDSLYKQTESCDTVAFDRSGNVLLAFEDGLKKIDIDTNTEIWSITLTETLQEMETLSDDTVIVYDSGQFLRALDSSDGSEIWSTDVDSVISGRSDVDGKTMAVDAYDDIYYADSGNTQVSKFNSDGTLNTESFVSNSNIGDIFAIYAPTSGNPNKMLVAYDDNNAAKILGGLADLSDGNFDRASINAWDGGNIYNWQGDVIYHEGIGTEFFAYSEDNRVRLMANTGGYYQDHLDLGTFEPNNDPIGAIRGDEESNLIWMRDDNKERAYGFNVEGNLAGTTIHEASSDEYGGKTLEVYDDKIATYDYAEGLFVVDNLGNTDGANKYKANITQSIQNSILYINGTAVTNTDETEASANPTFETILSEGDRIHLESNNSNSTGCHIGLKRVK